MKICRFSHQGKVAWGRLERDAVRVCKGNAPEALDPTSEVLPLAEVRMLAPLIPGKIICVGRNYAEHARELGNLVLDQEPLIFLKPPSAVISPGDPIVLPEISKRVDHEAELGVIFGKVARNLPGDENPLDYVFGYTCVNDVTARDLQNKDVQFTRAKSFDTFCPLGPWIETELDPTCAVVTGRVNGEVRQRGCTREMIFSVAHIIRFIAGIMTLFPGDLISTGTPAGVGPLASGDVVEVEVEGIGVLRNPVQ
jgi:2-keto-4-pentenoate hydratase/2-oxohepta-3-ene-1,7-dioic acid hydratase in catechol pathway